MLTKKPLPKRLQSRYSTYPCDLTLPVPLLYIVPVLLLNLFQATLENGRSKLKNSTVTGYSDSIQCYKQANLELARTNSHITEINYHPTRWYKQQSISLPASCLSEMMMRRRHFYVMESMFCELEIYSSPLNSSLQQTYINDLVLLSLMYKKVRDSLLHASVSQFMDRRRGSQSQLNRTLIKKNVRERVNECTLAPK